MTAPKSLKPALIKVMRLIKFIQKRPASRRVFRFIDRYSTQLGFAFLTLVFLMVTVGEGQAYEVSTPKLAAQFQTQKDGFIGKPQLYIGQTLLTGDIQQLVAINYTVEKGDSLTAIASRYNLSVGSIIQANNLSIAEIEKIKPGTALLIPAEETDTSLAWLDSLNKMKEDERQKAIAEQQKKEKERLARLARPTVRVAQSVGGSYSIIGTFRNLPTRGAMAGQCTNWVKYKRPDLPTQMGNANQYLVSARRYGFATGSTPRAGAVVVTNESWVGHVAYVESVNGDTITISEMNYVGPFIASRRTISIHSSVIRGYVY